MIRSIYHIIGECVLYVIASSLNGVVLSLHSLLLPKNPIDLMILYADRIYYRPLVALGRDPYNPGTCRSGRTVKIGIAKSLVTQLIRWDKRELETIYHIYPEVIYL